MIEDKDSMERDPSQPRDNNNDPAKKCDREEAKGHKATQFDGNPNPQGTDYTTFGPKDDTPMKLEKIEGSRNDQK